MEMSEILGGAVAPDESVKPEAPASTVETPPTPQAPVEPETTSGQPAEPKAPPPRDEHGRFTQRQDEAPPEEPESQRMVPLASLLEERRKRQELEQRYSQPVVPKRPPVTDDDFYTSPVTATQQMLDPVVEQFEQRVLAMQFNQGEAVAREAHADYEQVKQNFTDRLDRGDPLAVAIAQQMFAQANPPKYAYDQVKRLQTIESLGDPEAFRARIAAEERAKVMTELAAVSRPRPPDVPASLNAESSAPSSVSTGPFEPTPLTNIIRHNY